MMSKELDEWMEDNEDNKKQFIADKDKVVQMLIDKGEDCRIFPSDFEKDVIVKKKDKHMASGHLALALR